MRHGAVPQTQNRAGGMASRCSMRRGAPATWSRLHAHHTASGVDWALGPGRAGAFGPGRAGLGCASSSRPPAAGGVDLEAERVTLGQPEGGLGAGPGRAGPGRAGPGRNLVGAGGAGPRWAQPYLPAGWTLGPGQARPARPVQTQPGRAEMGGTLQDRHGSGWAGRQCCRGGIARGARPRRGGPRGGVAGLEARPARGGGGPLRAGPRGGVGGRCAPPSVGPPAWAAESRRGPGVGRTRPPRRGSLRPPARRRRAPAGWPPAGSGTYARLAGTAVTAAAGPCGAGRRSRRRRRPARRSAAGAGRGRSGPGRRRAARGWSRPIRAAARRACRPAGRGLGMRAPTGQGCRRAGARGLRLRLGSRPGHVTRMAGRPRPGPSHRLEEARPLAGTRPGPQPPAAAGGGRLRRRAQAQRARLRRAPLPRPARRPIRMEQGPMLCRDSA